MSEDPKYTPIFIAAGAALVIIGALGYKTWSLSQDLNSLQTEQNNSSSLIEELEELAQQEQAQSDSSLMNPWPSFAGDPFAQMRNMQQQMQSLFQSSNGFFNSNAMGLSFPAQNNMPEIQVQETTDAYEVIVEYGPNSELELSTNLEANVLSISATVRTELANSAGNFRSNSTSFSQFSRSIALDKPVDANGLRTENNENSITIIVPFAT
ncbi:MAG: Hsp20/alpha crystallin family protein [Pseudohongiellaceae bacterium]|nr:Hsp20/alpha crystallin family protein [Pseudohongiellaceae bacterium]